MTQLYISAMNDLRHVSRIARATPGRSVHAAVRRYALPALLLLASCGRFRAGKGDVRPSALHRPRGELSQIVSVSDRPFGIDIRDSTLVYITRLDARTVSVVNARTFAITNDMQVGVAPTDVAFSPDGATAYVTNQFSPNLGVIDVASSTQVATIAIPAATFKVCVSPDGSRVYVSASGNFVYVIDAASRALVGQIRTGSAPNGFAFHPSDTLLYISASLGGTVHEVNTKSRTVLRTFLLGGKPQGIAVSPDGTELYAANEAGLVQVVNLRTGATSQSLPFEGGPFDLALTGDGRQLYISLPGAGLVLILDRATRRPVKYVQTFGMPRRIRFSSDGMYAVVANEAGTLQFIR